MGSTATEMSRRDMILWLLLKGYTVNKLAHQRELGERKRKNRAR